MLGSGRTGLCRRVWLDEFAFALGGTLRMVSLISHLGLSEVGFYPEFAIHPVHDDIEMKLPHSGLRRVWPVMGIGA